PTRASPATVIAVLAGLLSPEGITNATTLVKAGMPSSIRPPGRPRSCGLACADPVVIALISHLGDGRLARYCRKNNAGKISKNGLFSGSPLRCSGCSCSIRSCQAGPKRREDKNLVANIASIYRAVNDLFSFLDGYPRQKAP